MLSYPKALQRLIIELTKLPSVGEKTATRLAYHLVNNDRDLCASLSQSLLTAANDVTLCERCFFLSERALCDICCSNSRDNSLVCVVEKPADVIAIERSGSYKGLYHVLHGIWAPLRGIGAEKLKIHELLSRFKAEPIKEAIIATSSTVEGDATALYLGRLLNEAGVVSTRIAQGMPKGGELEYADDITLSRALAGRSPIGS